MPPMPQEGVTLFDDAILPPFPGGEHEDFGGFPEEDESTASAHSGSEDAGWGRVHARRRTATACGASTG